MYCDSHSHLLWGIDDGAKDKETALSMMKKACADGISHIIATPHFVPGRFEPSAELIKERVCEANRLAKENGLDLTIYSGCEVAVDVTTIEMLRNKELLTLGDTRYILLEFNELYTEDLVLYMVERVLDMGYIPVIAHAEISFAYDSKCTFIKELVSRGALIQVSSQSIYDKGTPRNIKKYAKKILKGYLAFAVASDSHSDSWRPPVLSPAFLKVKKYCGEADAERLFTDNPLQMIGK